MFTIEGATDDGDGVPELSDLSSSTLSDKLQFGVTAPENLAAALDLGSVDGTVTTAPGDASNIDQLLAVRDQTTTYTVGKFTSTCTIEDLYSQTVTKVGSMASQASSDATLYADRQTQVEEYQSAMSGVSIDEELAKLINFQRAFEAAAKLVKVGDELLGEIIELNG